MIARPWNKKLIAGINKTQSGFTLMELLVAVAITGIISLGLVMTIYQIIAGNLRSSGEMAVIREAQNAGYWMSHDTQMAQDVSVDDDPGTADTELVTLTWFEYNWDSTTNDRRGYGHRVIYVLDGEELRRDYYTDPYEEGGAEPGTEFAFQNSTFVAKHLESLACVYLSGQLEITVTASVGGWQPQSATRKYKVMPRPDVMY